MSTARKQRQGEKGSDAQRSASKRKARGSHRQQGEDNRRRSKPTITHPDAAGIDVGARVHYVAVPEGRTGKPVRSFGSYTAQLEELVHWLKDCGRKTVAMDSTVVYGIPMFQSIADAGLVALVIVPRIVEIDD